MFKMDSMKTGDIHKAECIDNQNYKLVKMSSSSVNTGVDDLCIFGKM